MKRRDLIKLFEKNGWYLLRNGHEYDVYTSFNLTLLECK